jgi:hypothetical protein
MKQINISLAGGRKREMKAIHQFATITQTKAWTVGKADTPSGFD